MHSINPATSHNNSNTFLDLARDTNSIEMNLLASFCHPPKQEPMQQQQPLYRALMQQFGSIPVDPASLPHLLSTLSKRSAPVSIDARATPINITSATAANAQSDPVLSNATSPANFAMTAAITSALCSNAAVVGPQLLPACSPLLQLAIRQALGQCLPHFTQLNIQGNLEISVGSGASQTTHSMTVLKFNDTGLMQARFDPTVEKSYVNGFHINADVVTSTITASTMTATSNSRASSGAPAIPSNTEAEMHQDHTPTNGQVGTSSSRRKSTNPIKCTVAEMAGNLSGSADLSPITNTTTSPLILGRSGPTSPSTDSGVLDLSRNGSLTGSAPITPLKDLSLTHGSGKSDVIDAGRHQLLEAYQKQLTAFSQYHSVWNRAMFSSVDQRSNGDQPSTSPTSTLYLTSSNGALSAPNSPVKPARRQRVTTDGGVGGASNSSSSSGRMCPVRRPSSNRRFPCNQCREEFPSLHTLEEHTVFQHGTYRCHICKAQFTQRSNLQRHALKHVGFKPFECRVCSKAYYRKDHLMRHMEMGHPGYTPRENITVHLTSSESLDYLNRSGQQGLLPTSSASTTVTNITLHPSPSDPEDRGIGMEVDDEICRIDGEEEEDRVDCDLALNTSSPPNAHEFNSPGRESFEDEEADVRQPNEHSGSETERTAALSPESVEDTIHLQFDSHNLTSPSTFPPYTTGQESYQMTV